MVVLKEKASELDVSQNFSYMFYVLIIFFGPNSYTLFLNCDLALQISLLEPFVLSNLLPVLFKIFSVIWFWCASVVVFCSHILMKMVTHKVWISMVLCLFRLEVWLFVCLLLDLSICLTMCTWWRQSYWLAVTGEDIPMVYQSALFKHSFHDSGELMLMCRVFISCVLVFQILLWFSNSESLA